MRKIEIDGEQFPAKWEICPHCRGEGARALGGAAMTWDQMREEGEEFIEDYFAGHYDTTCEDCKGAGKVLVVDEEQLTEEQQKSYEEWCEAERSWREAQKAEYRLSAEYLSDIRGGY